MGRRCVLRKLVVLIIILALLIGTVPGSVLAGNEVKEIDLVSDVVNKAGTSTIANTEAKSSGSIGSPAEEKSPESMGSSAEEKSPESMGSSAEEKSLLSMGSPTEEKSLLSMGSPDSEAPVSYSARVSYTVEKVTADYNDSKKAVVNFALNEACQSPVSFDYSVIPGSAGGYFYSAVSVTTDTVSFAAGETSKTVEIPINKLVNNRSDSINPTRSNSEEFWNGERVFYVHCSNIQNAFFTYNEADYREIFIPVRIKNDTDFSSLYAKVKDFLIDLDTPETYSIINGTKAEGTNLDYILTYTREGYSLALRTSLAADGDTRKLIDTGILSHIELPKLTVSAVVSEGAISFGNSSYVIKDSDNKGFNSDIYIKSLNFPVSSEPMGTKYSECNPVSGAAILGEVSLAPGGEIIRMGPKSSTEDTRLITSLDLAVSVWATASDVEPKITASFGSNELLRFYDGAKPDLDEISSPVRSIPLKGIIPITVTFTEPVISDNVRLTIGNSEADSITLSPVEASGTISNKLSFLYQSSVDYNGTINYTITGAEDINGNKQAEIFGTIKADDLKAPAAYIYNSSDASTLELMIIAGVRQEISLEQGTKEAMEGKVTLHLDNYQALKNWITGNLSAADEDCVNTLYAKVTSYDEITKATAVTNISLYTDSDTIPTKLTGRFTAPPNSSGSTIAYVSEIYLDADGTGAGVPKRLYHLGKTYSVPPLIYIDEEADVKMLYYGWAESNRVTSDTQNLSVGYRLNVKATWNTQEYFKWSSSDETIATIASNGMINLTGKKGEVYFKLTVTNPINDTSFTFTSSTLTVTEVEETFLTAADSLDITKGNDAVVCFSSNLTEKNAVFTSNQSTETRFTVSLYNIVYDASEAKINGEAIKTQELISTTASLKTYFTIPAESLENTTVAGKYGYAAVISAISLNTRNTITAKVYIRVRPQPAKASLVIPKELYLTDETKVAQINYSIDNYLTGSTTFTLTVRRNSETADCYSTSEIAGYSHTGGFNISTVDDTRLLDTYTVTLKAQNVGDEVSSVDSYTLYVYNSDAFSFEINGKKSTGFTMDLPDLSRKTSDELFAMRESIRLTADIGIYKDKYTWNNVLDKFTWSVSDPDGLEISLNSDDTGSFDSSIAYTFRSRFKLIGFKSGNYTIRAVHTLTGIEASLPIKVKDISTRLVFLQVKPLCQFTASAWTDKGFVYKEFDKNGRLAWYLPDGFRIGVGTRCEEAYEPFIDTSFTEMSTLLGNQKVYNKTGIYPINTVSYTWYNYQFGAWIYAWTKNRQVQRYTGYVKVKSGVLLNGNLIENVRYKGGEKKLCSEEYIVHCNGSIILDFDPETIYSNNIPSQDDIIEYVVELIPCDVNGKTSNEILHETFRTTRKINNSLYWREYYPTYVYCLFLEQKDTFMPGGGSLLSQSFICDGVKTNYNDMLSLEEVPESLISVIELELTDDVSTNYSILLTDDKGTVIGESKCKAQREYPFSSVFTATFETDITEKVREYLNATKTIALPMKINLTLIKEDGSERYNFAEALNIRSLIGVPLLKTLEDEGGLLSELRNNVYRLLDMSKANNNSNNETSYLINILKDMSSKIENSDSAGIEIIPTDDPLVYNAVFRMAVGNYDRSNPSGVFVASGKDSEVSKTPSLEGLKAAYAISQDKFISNAKKQSKLRKDKNMILGGGIYMDGIIYFNVASQKWCFTPYYTSSYLAGGLSVERRYNTKVGPVPVCGKFSVTGTLEAGFGTVKPSNSNSDDIIYITSLAPDITFTAFGGFGFDYPAAKLCIGPYGLFNHYQQFLWMRQGNTIKNGQMLLYCGETGIRFEAKVLGIGYDKKFKIASKLVEKTYGDYGKVKPIYYRSGLYNYMGSNEAVQELSYSLVPVSESTEYESRDYLTAFDRTWENTDAAYTRLLDSSPFTLVMDNAYPESTPALTEDGKMMVLMSDMGSTDLNESDPVYSLRNSMEEGFSEAKPIDTDNEYPDYSLTIAGTLSHASAAWIRGSRIVKSAGDEASDKDVMSMLTGTELMVSDYNGSAWTTRCLTKDGRIDILPSIAVAGNKSVVVWVSSLPGSPDDPLKCTDNRILYSLFDGDKWSDVRTLYEAGTDSISNISTVILDDGTINVTYLLKPAVEGSSMAEGYIEEENSVYYNKVAGSVINKSGELVSSMTLSDSSTVSNAISTTAVEFPDGNTRFVIGWQQSEAQGNGLLKITALNCDGTVYNGFSFELEGENGYENFRFSKGSKKLSELSILYSGNEISKVTEGTEGAAPESISTVYLCGQRFSVKKSEMGSEADSEYMLTSKQKLISLPENTALSSYDCSVSEDKLGFVLLTSQEVNELEKSAISRVLTSYKEYSISLPEPEFDYSQICPGFLADFMYEITNEGTEPISSLTVSMNGQDYEFKDLNVASGETKTFTLTYTVPETIADVNYSITAYYDDKTAGAGGTLRLTLPNVGIMKAELRGEGAGERNIALMLTSVTELPINASTQKVFIQASASSDYEAPLYETELTAEEINELNTNGKLDKDVTLNLKDSSFSNLLNGGEIPEDGIWLFFRVSLREGTVTADADSKNNYGYIRLESKGNDTAEVSFNSALTLRQGKSYAQVEAINNRLQPVSDKNIVVSLLDKDGNVIETRQTYIAGNQSSLVSIEGENSITKEFAFSKQGQSISVRLLSVEQGNHDPSPGTTTNPILTPEPSDNSTPEPSDNSIPKPIAIPTPIPDSTGDTEEEETTDEPMLKDVVIGENAPETFFNNEIEELAESLLTKREKARVKQGEKAQIYLEIKARDNDISKEEKKLVNKELRNLKKQLKNDERNASDVIQGFYIDISLYKKIGNSKPKKIAEPGTKISISIKIPERLIKKSDNTVRTYWVVTIHDGKAKAIEGTFDPKTGYFTFETDEFSSYTLVYSDIEKQLKWGEVYETMTVGETKTFTIDVFGIDTDKLVWKTKKKRIAVVKKSKGKLESTVTARSAGEDVLYIRNGREKIIAMKIVVTKKK